MLVGELDGALGILGRADELEIAIALDDGLDEGTGEGVVVGDDQTEGHLPPCCTPIV